MAKFTAQSFNQIAAKYKLKKVFSVYEIKTEDYDFNRPKMICLNCNHQIANKCDCKTPQFQDGNDYCSNPSGYDEICGGIKDEICQCEQKRIQPPNKYISIYETVDCYGGPEEGGWWYNTSYLQESYECQDEEQAYQIREEMLQLADDLNKAEINHHNRHLAESLDWLEARGLEPEFLPEPDGPTKYWISTEWYPGENHSGNYRPHYC